MYEDLKEIYPEVPVGKAKDLSGTIHGNYTILYRTISPKNIVKKRAYWVCKCNFCGKIRISSTRSSEGICSCQNRYGKKDLTNKKIGKITCLYPTEKRDHNRSVIWCCKCDCGKIFEISVHDLLNCGYYSCGCSKNNSRNEDIISKILINKNINFLQQKQYHDLKNRYFDFYIDDKYILEYDGAQHFYYRKIGWNTKENFEVTRQHDLEKNKYCFNNNIPLIRIPYDAEYTFEDLMLETTRFLLTPENEKEYYKSRMKEVNYEENQI